MDYFCYISSGKWFFGPLFFLLLLSFASCRLIFKVTYLLSLPFTPTERNDTLRYNQNRLHSFIAPNNKHIREEEY